MASIGLIAQGEEDRSRLRLLCGELGHAAHAGRDLSEAAEILRGPGAQLLILVAEPHRDAELAVRELLRLSPLLPVVVALQKRDAKKAVNLIKTGAVEVLAPPWTRENLGPVLSKGLRLKGPTLSPAPQPRLGPRFYLLAVLIFLAAAFGVTALKRQVWLKERAAAQTHFWDLPYGHPAAAAFDGREFWIMDWFSQSLYVHDSADLSVKRVISFPHDPPVALAFAPETVWSATGSGFLVRHMRDEKLTAVARYADEAPNTLGLAFDGLYLWSFDSRKKQLHKRLLDKELTILASFPYPGSSPAALVFDGKSLWSLDSENRELVLHNLDRPDEALRRVGLAEYQDGRYRPVGLAYDGERFWTVAESRPRDTGPARLFRHAAIGP